MFKKLCRGKPSISNYGTGYLDLTRITERIGYLTPFSLQYSESPDPVFVGKSKANLERLPNENPT